MLKTQDWWFLFLQGRAKRKEEKARKSWWEKEGEGKEEKGKGKEEKEEEERRKYEYHELNKFYQLMATNEAQVQPLGSAGKYIYDFASGLILLTEKAQS